MIRGDFLYSVIADKKMICVGYEEKSIWRDGEATKDKKIVARCYILGMGNEPVQIRVTMPCKDDIKRSLEMAIGSVVEPLAGVFSGIDVAGAYTYQGTLRASYIGLEADKLDMSGAEVLLD